MRYAAILAIAPLTLALTACGGGADDAETPEAAGDAVGEVVPAASTIEEGAAAAGEAEVAGEGGEAESAPEATPSPTPTATATVAPAPTPTPTPTQAAPAVAGPPPQFALCRACHSVKPGENGIGPSLAGVVGAKAGHVGSFDYSDAMAGSGLTWNQATLDRYLENPQGVVPGTTMSFGGVKNADHRKAIIDYLRGL